jgi:lysozyme family protein
LSNNFNNTLPLVLKAEGGYTNDPHDPGGATNFGVIQTEYNSYLRMKGITPHDVKDITQDEYEEIYRHLYWDKVWGDKLPDGLDYAVFDYAVNSGPHRAITELQKLLNSLEGRNLVVDGNIGSATLDACTDIEDLRAFVIAYCNARLSFLQRLKTWRFFGKGWKARVLYVKEVASDWAEKAPKVEKPEVPNLGGAADRPVAPNAGMATMTIGSLVTGAMAALTPSMNNPYALAAMVILLCVSAFAIYRKLA